MEPARERQSGHMSHRDIHQRDHKQERNHQAELHIGNLFLNMIDRLLRLPGRLRTVYRRAIACVLHRMDDLWGIHRGFVILNRHIVGKQVHRDCADSLHLRHRFLHMRRTSRAGHTRHIEFLFHPYSSFSPLTGGVGL